MKTDNLTDSASGNLSREPHTAETPEDAEADARYWKRVALYLAECHAATAESDCVLSSTSKSRKGRLVSICHTAAAALRGEPSSATSWSARTMDATLQRLDRVVADHRLDAAPAK